MGQAHPCRCLDAGVSGSSNCIVARLLTFSDACVPATDDTKRALLKSDSPFVLVLLLGRS